MVTLTAVVELCNKLGVANVASGKVTILPWLTTVVLYHTVAFGWVTCAKHYVRAGIGWGDVRVCTYSRNPIVQIFDSDYPSIVWYELELFCD